MLNPATSPGSTHSPPYGNEKCQRIRGGTPGSLGSLIKWSPRSTCPFTCILIRIPLEYNEANLYALYDRFLVALSTHKEHWRATYLLYQPRSVLFLGAGTVPIFKLCCAYGKNGHFRNSSKKRRPEGRDGLYEKKQQE